MNYPRTEYEMTQEDYDKIIKACSPVPMIMLHIGTPRSQQENANDAWAELGKRMGFDGMTVQPSSKGNLFFTAIPSEPENLRKEREAKEAEENKKKQIEQLKTEILEREEKIKELVG